MTCEEYHVLQGQIQIHIWINYASVRSFPCLLLLVSVQTYSSTILPQRKELPNKYFSFFQNDWSIEWKKKRKTTTQKLQSRYTFASVGRWVVSRTQLGCDSVLNILFARLSAVISHKISIKKRPRVLNKHYSIRVNQVCSLFIGPSGLYI